MSDNFIGLTISVPGAKVDAFIALINKTKAIFEQDPENLRMEVVQQSPAGEDGNVYFSFHEEFANKAARDRWVAHDVHKEDRQALIDQALATGPPIVLSGSRVINAGSKA